MTERRKVKPTGGTTASAVFTTMKLAAHRIITTRIPTSASRRSDAAAGGAAGDRSAAANRPTAEGFRGDPEPPAGSPAGVTFVWSARSAVNRPPLSEVRGGAPRGHRPGD